ncbi:hypothetical protein GBA52_001128 [Prunus armeniaca]|nr:hypothetical protein GBA52_001128 [Prunus armeniaca]
MSNNGSGRISSFDMWRNTSMEAFSKSSHHEEDDEESLTWAAIERLPTYLRIRRGLLAEEDGQAAALEGQETNVVTDYIIKVLGLEVCADTMVGDQMRRGISGGQKKRLTTAIDKPQTVMSKEALEEKLAKKNGETVELPSMGKSSVGGS